MNPDVPATKSAVVIPAQQEIEVFENTAGAIVIRMDAGGVYDEDQMVVIQRQNVVALIEALTAELIRIRKEGAE